MERISLNKEVSLSRIVYGMWRLGDDKNTSPDHVRAKIDASLDQGITSFDQADIYGGYIGLWGLAGHCTALMFKVRFMRRLMPKVHPTRDCSG